MLNNLKQCIGNKVEYYRISYNIPNQQEFPRNDRNSLILLENAEEEIFCPNAVLLILNLFYT